MGLTAVKVVQFLAVVLTALTLSPGVANGLALPGKLHLLQERYYAVQAIYRGWDLSPSSSSRRWRRT